MDIDSWRVIGIEPMGRALDHPELILSDEDQKYLFEFIRNKRIAGAESTKISILRRILPSDGFWDRLARSVTAPSFALDMVISTTKYVIADGKEGGWMASTLL